MALSDRERSYSALGSSTDAVGGLIFGNSNTMGVPSPEVPSCEISQAMR